MCTSKLLKQDVPSTSFMWSDNGKSIPTGPLLSALIRLTDAVNKDPKQIQDKQVADYLVEKGFVTKRDDGKYDVVNEKKEEMIQLGDGISDLVDKELEQHVNMSNNNEPQVLIVMPVTEQ